MNKSNDEKIEQNVIRLFIGATSTLITFVFIWLFFGLSFSSLRFREELMKADGRHDDFDVINAKEDIFDLVFSFPVFAGLLALIGSVSVVVACKPKYDHWFWRMLMSAGFVGKSLLAAMGVLFLILASFSSDAGINSLGFVLPGLFAVSLLMVSAAIFAHKTFNIPTFGRVGNDVVQSVGGKAEGRKFVNVTLNVAGIIATIFVVAVGVFAAVVFSMGAYWISTN